jgi:hypothetical protein
VDLIVSGLSRRGNNGDAKKVSRKDFVLHSINAGGQLRTIKLGLISFSTSPSCLSLSMIKVLGFLPR